MITVSMPENTRSDPCLRLPHNFLNKHIWFQMKKCYLKSDMLCSKISHGPSSIQNNVYDLQTNKTLQNGKELHVSIR